MTPASVILLLRTIRGFPFIRVKGKINMILCEALFSLLHPLHPLTLSPITLPFAHSIPAILTSLIVFDHKYSCLRAFALAVPLIQEGATPGFLRLVLLLQWSLLWPYIQNCMILPNTYNVFSMLYFYLYHCYHQTSHILHICVILCLYPCSYSHTYMRQGFDFYLSYLLF